MPCYKPLRGWRSTKPNANGKFPVVFTKPKQAEECPVIEVPCGKCIGCRLEYSRQWAMRIEHENQMHEQSAFITLTYDPENLPENSSLNVKDWELFLKNFRKILAPKRIRFFMCGEYGENPPQPWRKFGHPHFHAVIFGWFPDSDDLEPIKRTGSGEIIYQSRFLDSIWQKGFASVGHVTFQSAAYVARYVTKKITGESAGDHYTELNLLTGEQYELNPEFCRASRRPGIGGKWFKKYKNDLKKGFITVQGRKMSQPKYYDYIMQNGITSEGIDPDEYTLDWIKNNRAISALDKAHDNTDERLQVKEKVKRKKLKLLPRGNIKND